MAKRTAVQEAKATRVILMKGNQEKGFAVVFKDVNGRRHKLTGQQATLLVMLANFGGPFMLLATMAYLLASPLIPKGEDVDLIETFAGEKAIGRAFKRAKYKTASHEILDDNVTQDFLSPLGYCYLLSLGCRAKAGCANTNGMVCSSWVFLNRGTNKRTWVFPLGDPRVPSVRAGNEMVSKLFLFLMIMTIKGAFWLLEQPVSSLMHRHGRFQDWARNNRLYRQFVWLGAYGAESPKGITLYSPFPWISELYKPLPNRVWPAEVSHHWVNSDGTPKVSGGSALKATQTYPVAFGVAVEKLYTKHHGDIMKKAEEMKAKYTIPPVETSKTMEATPKARWDDARLDDILAHLGI